jgi:YHS domain-containing protein
MLLRAVLEIVFILLVARAFWNLVAGILQGISGEPRRREVRRPDEAVSMVRDPVCGTFVLPDRAVSIVDGRGRVHFCSIACRDKYRSRTA